MIAVKQRNENFELLDGRTLQDYLRDECGMD